MGFSEKAQVEGGVESDTNSNNNNRKWVIAGIALRAPLKPLNVVEKEQKVDHDHDHEQGLETAAEECSSTSTTPTSAESKIPTPFTCPPPPRKRKPSSKCKFHVREFFNPPDLESVFIRHVEKAL